MQPSWELWVYKRIQTIYQKHLTVVTVNDFMFNKQEYKLIRNILMMMRKGSIATAVSVTELAVSIQSRCHFIILATT